jgi:tight adherence protein C
MTPVEALRVSVLAVACVAFSLGAYAVVSARSRLPQHLGLRGRKRIDMLRRNQLFVQVEPLMRWLSTRLSDLISPALRTHLDRQIVLAGDLWGLGPEDVVSLSLLSCLSGVALGVGYGATSHGGPLFALLLGTLGLLAPYLQLASKAQTRLRSVRMGLPHVIDLLALSLGAGLDFPAAVRQVVDRASRRDDPVVEELTLVLQELNLGRTRRQALQQFASRAPCDVVRELVAAVVQSEEQGTPLASVLKTQASSSRAQRSAQAEEAASRAGAALLVPLMLLFACVLMLIVAPMILQVLPQLNE